jgi:phosphoribosyl-ATP pyrophosphohydrolase
MSEFTIEDLAAIVAARAGSGDASSYTAKLIGQGISACAKKLGEEAVETVIAAVAEDRERLASEAADLLYHLMVLLQVGGVTFDEVKAELGRRTGQTGLEEKARRSAGT